MGRMNQVKYRKAERRLWESVGAEPQETFITSDMSGAMLRVLEVGEGEPVLFVHGGPNAASTWAPLIPHLEGFACKLVDRPGTGLSERYRVTAANLPEFGSGFVGDVLDGLGIERAHIVASSFGGHLALRSAASHSERFDRMVQMAAPALAPGQVFPPFMRSLQSPLVRKVINTMPPNRRINLNIMRQIGHESSLDRGRIPEVFFDWYLALGRHTVTMRHDGHMIGAEILPNVETLTLTPDLLGSVSTPTLFLWGADDGFGGKDNARLVTEMLPNAELVMLPDSGHLPWLDDPERIGAHTREFLTARSPTQGVESGSVKEDLR